MPAFKSLLLLVLIMFTALPSLNPVHPAVAQPYSGTIVKALQWLSSNQSSNGWFGSGVYGEHWTAAAAYALWLNNSSSSRADAAYSWLSSSLASSSSWYWDPNYGEADVPGAVLFLLSVGGQTSRLAGTNSSTMLLDFQNLTSGGFRGYYDSSQKLQVTSSVDTAFALLGLTGSSSISTSRTNLATSYLLKLQNNDGSFNLTQTISSDAIDALGPDSISTTALVAIALGHASFKSTDSRISSGLDYLANHLSPESVSQHVYSASLAAIALDEFNRIPDANRVLGLIGSNQRIDGGFRDGTRSPMASNALDTGWAAIALQSVRLVSGSPLLSSLFTVSLVTVTAIIALSIIVLVIRRRHDGRVISS